MGNNCKSPTGSGGDRIDSSVPANSTYSGKSEADVKAHFGNVPVLCANGDKKGCTEWRRASECPDKNWVHNMKCNGW